MGVGVIAYVTCHWRAERFRSAQGEQIRGDVCARIVGVVVAYAATDNMCRRSRSSLSRGTGDPPVRRGMGQGWDGTGTG